MWRIIFLALILATSSGAYAAGGRAELLELKNTILNLVDALVEQGILTAEKAEALKLEAQQKALVDAEAEAVEEEEEPLPLDPPGKKVVRVPYVPEIVKDEIRDQVRRELRAEVLEDVTQVAKAERWGTPDALPDWVNRFSFHGDFRLREEGLLFAEQNPRPTDANAIIDFQEVNERGLFFNNPSIFENFAEDRERLRLRLRLGFDVKLTEQADLGFRITTGSVDNPLSLNNTFGNFLSRQTLLLDRAFLQWRFDAPWAENFLTITGGRFEKPFFSTDLYWDNDLSFDGFVLDFQMPYLIDKWSDNPANRLWLTLGVFPLNLDETRDDDNSSNDKWLAGGQLGLEHQLTSDVRFTGAFALYDYSNIVGRVNPTTLIFNPGVIPDDRTDWTAPDFLQKGNTLYPIKFDSRVVNPGSTPLLFGLAADYTLAAVTGEFQFSFFDPVEVRLTGDLVKNIGYTASSVNRRLGFDFDERSLGWHVRLDVGNARFDSGPGQVRKFGDWNVFLGWKHLQRDAALDAFVDSNLLGGGTNAEGWMLGAQFGLTRHLFTHLRIISADEIDGFNDFFSPVPDNTPLGIDVLHFDLNAQF